MLNNSSENEPLLARYTQSPRSDRDSRRKVRLGPLEIPKSTRYGILAGVWSATFLSSLNSTLVPTMLPSISSDFKRFNQASWLGTAYLLATCTFTPLYGRLCNVLGRKGASQLALLFTALGVLGCGLSKNMESLIASRFLSGIGGGGLFTVSSIVVSDMYSMRDRGLAQGIASVFSGLGMGLGGPFGGLVTDWLGWRWAFLIQLPLFIVSFFLTTYFTNYITPVGATLIFLSVRYNEGQLWSNPAVIASVTVAAVGSICFLLMELFVAREPVLAPFLLKQKIPVLVGTSNFLVAICNFSIIYFFPMWFQTVLSTNASIAGLHLVPNSIGMSSGSIFAGYIMHRTGRYKTINFIFGSLPFLGACLIASLQRNSSPYLNWLSILPLGFGNAVVLQTMLIALLVHLPESQMAVGTGFGQLFRGIGQVGGVAIASAIFQSKLDSELRRHIHTPDADELIMKIRHSSKLVATLPQDLQVIARDSYEKSLKAVFILSACSTLLAFVVRLPIPDKDLDTREKGDPEPPAVESPLPTDTHTPTLPYAAVAEDEAPTHKRKRRLSTYESTDGIMDLEGDTSGPKTPE